MNLNKTLHMGNLTRDPELKFTPQGTAICKFSIAINRKYKQGEEWKTEVQFFNIVVWGKSAEACGKHLSKGSGVFVEGRLQNRSWEHEGVKKYATEIIAENVQFLGSPKGEKTARTSQETGQGDAEGYPGQFDQGADSEMPF